MHRSNDTSTYADTGSTARCLNAAASYISIPQCTGLKSEILLSGTTERFVSLLHEISKFTDIRPLLQGNETAAGVFKQALQQWFSELIPESVQQIVSFSPVFFTAPNSNDYTDCNFGTKEGDYMLLFQFNLLHINGFELIDILRYYETLSPGLGQNILCKIESASPFRIGTPRDLLNFVQDNIWGGNETEDGYIEDMISCDDYTIGVGGGGSLVLSGLVRLHLAMKSLGHPHGLAVNVWDPDIVSQANVGRQLFAPNEIGLNKAEVLVSRYNLGFALNWKAHPERYNNSSYSRHIIIACVDSRKSRKEIFQTLPKRNGPYVLDAGVMQTYGQVVIGNGSKELPYPYKEIPDLINTRRKENNLPSCSLAEALTVQELFVNQWTATAELELCWRLLRKGGLDYRGFYINLDNGRMNPIPIKN